MSTLICESYIVHGIISVKSIDLMKHNILQVFKQSIISVTHDLMVLLDLEIVSKYSISLHHVCVEPHVRLGLFLITSLLSSDKWKIASQ